jgi:hypothetical protein
MPEECLQSQEDKMRVLDRRAFLKFAGAASLAAASLSFASGTAGETRDEEAVITDALLYITGGRLQFGTLRIEPALGHAVVLQRMDTTETWIGAWKDGIQSWNAMKIFGTPNTANPLPYRRWSAWEYEPDTPREQLEDRTISWTYDRPDLLQRLRDIKDNLKYLPEGQEPTIDPDEIREEFTWLQYRHIREVFRHPLKESFQVKKVAGYRWEYPHCEPLWVPRLDQKAKWAPFMAHPEKRER